MFRNPRACPVWTARIRLEGPPSPPWKATSLSHILTRSARLAPRWCDLTNSPVGRLSSVARGGDPVVNQLLFAVMPLDFSGLDLPGLLDLGSISHLSTVPRAPLSGAASLRAPSWSVLTADRVVNPIRQREMLTAAFGCDESGGGGEVGRDSRLSGP